MIKETTITIPAHLIDDDFEIEKYILESSGITKENFTGATLLKKSIDARGKVVKFILQYRIFINEPVSVTPVHFEFKDVNAAKHTVHIIGAGPAGIICALTLLQQGIKPIIYERGKDVRARRRDLAILNKEGILHEDSNYCFGEGGAGTYSDGKLYTRSGKRGSIERMLQLFVFFGADANILTDAHPHIGTNKLPQIIVAMREKIMACGGEILFEHKLTNIIVRNNCIVNIIVNGRTIDTKNVVLATGHSARDIYTILQNNNIAIEPKPLAIGVRIEHPQAFVDKAQYHNAVRPAYLPPASYSLVQQVDGRGVFSFCMCPGGIIATASTQQNRLVVNGWSPSKRNNPYANSGMVVAVSESDFKHFAKHKNLAGMHYQDAIEQKAFEAGGGLFKAPAQRVTDFIKNKTSNTLPTCSYLPGTNSANIWNVLPKNIANCLAEALKEFDKKMKGYVQQDAIIVATESRTSAPVRIPRHADTLEHIHITGLYPCAEGAGYAGGIISAGMDGEKVAMAIVLKNE
jgi:uncharacterized protein